MASKNSYGLFNYILLLVELPCIIMILITITIVQEHQLKWFSYVRAIKGGGEGEDPEGPRPRLQIKLIKKYNAQVYQFIISC